MKKLLKLFTTFSLINVAFVSSSEVISCTKYNVDQKIKVVDVSDDATNNTITINDNGDYEVSYQNGQVLKLKVSALNDDSEIDYKIGIIDHEDTGDDIPYYSDNFEITDQSPIINISTVKQKINSIQKMKFTIFPKSDKYRPTSIIVTGQKSNKK